MGERKNASADSFINGDYSELHNLGVKSGIKIAVLLSVHMPRELQLGEYLYPVLCFYFYVFFRIS